MSGRQQERIGWSLYVKLPLDKKGNGPKLIYGSDKEFNHPRNHFNNSLWNQVLLYSTGGYTSTGTNLSLPCWPFNVALREIPPFIRLPLFLFSGQGFNYYDCGSEHGIKRRRRCSAGRIHTRVQWFRVISSGPGPWSSSREFLALLHDRVDITFQRKRTTQLVLFFMFGQSYIM